MLKVILVGCFFICSSNVMALDFNGPIKGDTSFHIMNKDNLEIVNSVASIINFRDGFKDGDSSRGTYSYGGNNGTIQIKKIVYDVFNTTEDDVYRLEDAGVVNLSECEFVLVGTWRGGSQEGRISWCYLKQPSNGQNLKGVFWFGLDSPEFDGFWTGNLYN